jgi:type IV pilus assembly protein PilC
VPVYQFRAIDAASYKVIEGRFEAENMRSAKEMLREQGQIPTRLEEDNQTANLQTFLQQIPIVGELFVPRIGLKDLNLITQQLTTLLDSGIPLIEALYMLEQQTTKAHIRKVLKQVRGDVISGDSFSMALARFPQDFPTLYTQMIRAGEVSGELDRMCGRLADLYEKYLELQRKVTSALVYPAVTVVIIVGVIIVIMVVVVPQFKNVFSSHGAKLPLPTQVLMATSDFTLNFWWAVLVGAFALVSWFNIFRIGPGKPFIDQWMLTLPLFGPLFQKLYVSRFTRTLATVLASGVSLTEGIVTAAGTVDNYVMRAAFEKARDSLLVGGTLSRPLEQTGLFPTMVTKMMAIGEETGEMDKMLQKSANWLDIEVDQAIETMTTLIEPLMIVILGGVLLGVALSLYMPLFDMGKVMTH